MSYVYGKYFKERTSAHAYKKYIGARFARVYPLHFFTLVFSVICATTIIRLSSSLDPFFADMFNIKTGAPASLLLLQAMHVFHAAPLNTPSWSLSTEWWMYMIFPFLVPLFFRLKTTGQLVALLLIAVFFICIRYFIGPLSGPIKGSPTINLVADFGFIRCVAGFLLGMLLFTFYQANAGYGLFKNSWCFILLFAGALTAMHFGIMDILIVAFFPLIILAAAYNNTWIKKILDTRALQRLGDWSFSIYMVHVPLMMLFWIYTVNKEPGFFSDFMMLISRTPDYRLGVVLCIVTVALTLFVASLTYKYVEVPARNYLNSVFDEKHKQIAVESVKV